MKVILYDVVHSDCRRNLMLFDGSTLRFYRRYSISLERASTNMRGVAHIVLKRRQ